MNFNTKETLIGLQCLGLDLETGKFKQVNQHTRLNASNEYYVLGC